MRKRYLAWEKATLSLLEDVRADIAAASAAAKDLATNAQQLVTHYPTTENVVLLSTIHGHMDAVLLGWNLARTNAMFYLGARFLSDQINKAGVIDTSDVLDKVTKSLGSESKPLIKPIVAHAPPTEICAQLAAQNLDDQLGVSIEAQQDASSVTALLVFDCYADGDSWSLLLGRRASACKRIYFDILLKRSMEKELTSYILSKQPVKLQPQLPLPNTAASHFGSIGSAVTGCFVALTQVSSSVVGFKPKTLLPLSPTIYQLPANKDLGITLSSQACEALLAGLLDQFENKPEFYNFFHEAFFHKWLDRNSAVTFDEANGTVNCNVGFGAKYEATTLGKDWNFEASGWIPVSIVFDCANDQDKMTLSLRMRQTGDLTIGSWDLHAGPIGDVVKKVAQDKIDDLVHSFQGNYHIDETFPFFTLNDFRCSQPRVTSKLLIIELEMAGATVNGAVA